MILYDYII